MDPTDATVLIVDDEPGVADGYAARLERDHEVLTAYGGREALDRLDESVDAVLLDRQLPDVSGDEVLETVVRRGLDCRVAMITAIEPADDVVDLRVDDYLTKPVEEGGLRDLVESLLVRPRVGERGQDPIALAAKKTALEDHRSPEELADSDAYRELERRLDAARSEVREALDAVTRGAPDTSND